MGLARQPEQQRSYRTEQDRQWLHIGRAGLLAAPGKAAWRNFMSGTAGARLSPNPAILYAETSRQATLATSLAGGVLPQLWTAAVDQAERPCSRRAARGVLTGGQPARMNAARRASRPPARRAARGGSGRAIRARLRREAPARQPSETRAGRQEAWHRNGDAASTRRTTSCAISAMAWFVHRDSANHAGLQQRAELQRRRVRRASRRCACAQTCFKHALTMV